MERSDYPLLFQAADEGAAFAQRKYLGLIQFEISVLIVAAILSSFNLAPSSISQGQEIATSFFIFFGFLGRILRELVGFERQWFGCRAIAESSKSMSWKYMIRVKEFNGEPNSEAIDKVFLNGLRNICESQIEGAKSLSKHQITGDQITRKMRSTRNLSFADRKGWYHKERLLDQKEWYHRKSILHEHGNSIWFWTSIGIEGMAVVLAIALIALPSLPINPVGILITIAVAIVAWSQLKRHRELAQAYNLVAQELGQVSSLYIYINNEYKLEDFVEQTESIISREHKLWLHRRDS